MSRRLTSVLATSRRSAALVLGAAAGVTAGAARAQTAPAPPVAPARDAAVRVAADARLELVAIVFRLGGASEFANTQYAPYDTALRRHFEPFRAHEAVALARDLHERRGVEFSTVMALAIALGPFSDFALRVDPDSALGRVPGPDLTRFAEALRRFARDADASRFFAEQRPRLDSAAARLARPVRKADAFGWIAGFFGAPAGQTLDRAFVVAPLLANSQGNFGPCVRPTRGDGAGTLECWQILGHQATDSAGWVVWGDQTVETLVHEVIHGYANPLGDANRAALEPPLARVTAAFAGQMAAQAYTRPMTVLNESLVRAAVTRFFADRETPARAHEYLAEQRGLGWLWLPELADRFAAYERDRRAYPTFAAFMPRVVAYYDSLPDRVPAIKRAYDAGHPRVVATTLGAGYVPGDTAVVDPGVREIVVRFDRPVRPHRFAVAPLFVDGRPVHTQVPPPPVTGVALDAAGTTARLAVALEPGRAYAFQLNTPHGFGFRTPDGVPLAPYVIRLRVRAQ